MRRARVAWLILTFAAGVAACFIHIGDVVAPEPDSGDDGAHAGGDAPASADTSSDDTGSDATTADACRPPTIGYMADDEGKLRTFTLGVLPVDPPVLPLLPCGDASDDVNYAWSITASPLGKLVWVSSRAAVYTLDPAQLSAGCLQILDAKTQGKGFWLFSMAYMGEDLYISDTGYTVTQDASRGLAKLDLGLALVTPVGPYGPSNFAGYGAEITSDHEGGLAALFAKVPEAGMSTIGAIQLGGAQAMVADARTLPFGPTTKDYTFTFYKWDDDYWIFEGRFRLGDTTVRRLHPDGGYETAGSLGFGVTGIAIPRCAP
jgi:hypothetical protein